MTIKTQLQGRKRPTIVDWLTKAVAEDGLAYSPELSEELLLAAGGDIDMYRKDRQSDFVKESFQTDQKVAREMGIKQHPTAVVYNYTCENDFGILVENFENMDEIKQLCRVHPHNEPLLNQGDATFELNVAPIIIFQMDIYIYYKKMSRRKLLTNYLKLKVGYKSFRLISHFFCL